MAAPAAYNITFTQGDDVSETFTFKDSTGAAINVTGYTFAAMMRKTPADTTIVATFSFAITSGSGGTVNMTLAKTVTAGLTPGVYVYDLQWTDLSGNVRTMLAGQVTVLAEVTR